MGLLLNRPWQTPTVPILGEQEGAPYSCKQPCSAPMALDLLTPPFPLTLTRAGLSQGLEGQVFSEPC